MIIYGFRDRESIVGGGEFPCPCCKASRPYALVSVRRWFTLYFLPLIPLYFRGRYLRCYQCAQTFGEEYALGANPFLTGDVPAPVYPLAATPFPVAELAQETNVAPGKPHPAVYETGPSPALSITSLLFGILSPFFFLACGASIFTSLIAVICGHLSLRRKPDAMGRTGGRGMAIAGLVLGYIFLLLSPVAIYGAYQFFRNAANAPRQMGDERIASVGDGSGAERLKAMERRVMTSANGSAQGNTEAAQRLAQAFSEAMGKVRDVAITKNEKKGLQLTGGKFVTYCELRNNACTFVVHVPEFRNYDDDAKKFICEMGWIAAQDCALKEIGLGGELALGMKGVLNYGGVMTGTCNGPPTRQEIAESANESVLASFLERVRTQAVNEAAEAQPGSVASAPLPSTSTPTTPPITTPAISPPSTASSSSAPSTNFTPPEVRQRPQRTPYTPPIVMPTTPKAARPKAAGPVPHIERVKSIVVDESMGPEKMTITADGSMLAASFFQNLRAYDLREGREIAKLQCPRDLIMIQCMHFSEDGKKLFLGSSSGAVQAWEITEGNQFSKKASLHPVDGMVLSLATRGEATFVIAGSITGRLNWQPSDVDMPTSIRRAEVSGLTVHAIYLPKEGMEFFAADSLKLAQFDMRTQELKSVKNLPPTFIMSLDFSSDGKFIAGHSPNGLHILSTDTGTVVKEYREFRDLRGPVRYLPGTSLVAVGVDRGVAIFDANLGYLTTIDLLPNNRRVKNICASKQGDLLVVGGDGKEIEIFSISDATTISK